MTNLDDMLSKWPMREATQLEVDETAERVTAAVQAGQVPSSIDESVLAAPLPKTPDEGQTSAPRVSRPGIAAVENKMSKDRTRDRTSFQELAKMATTPPPPSNVGSLVPPSASTSGVVRGKEADASDSGIVDLKMIASADPSGEQRAQSTPLAASGLFEDESAPAKPAVSAAVAQQVTEARASSPSAAVSPSVAPAAAGSVAKTPSVAPAKTEQKKGGGVVIVLGALVAAAAIAAGGFFFIKYQRAHAGAVAMTTAAATNGDKAAPKPGATTPSVAGSVALTDTQELADNGAIDPNAASGVGKSMTKYRAKPTGGGVVAPTETAQAAPTGTVDPKLVANIPTGGAGGGNGDLNEAMKTAAGGGTGLGQGGGGGDQGTKFAPGSVPQRPSQGQVAGAIGSVMQAAKACLGGDEPLSRATVTFQSDGTVKGVSVSGFAAGKPQEACIKSALSKATVSPFAEATYPVPVTIRSN